MPRMTKEEKDSFMGFLEALEKAEKKRGQEEQDAKIKATHDQAVEVGKAIGNVYAGVLEGLAISGMDEGTSMQIASAFVCNSIKEALDNAND